MKQAVSSPKTFSPYSKSAHGVSVAVTLPLQVDAQSEYVVIAVRNTLSAPVRLLEGQPELNVETLDKHGRPILTAAPVDIRQIVSTLPDSRIIAPGSTVYFTVAFTSPVLDANQYLRVTVGQTLAADEPSIIDLSVKSR
jgi:hypothetical protein